MATSLKEISKSSIIASLGDISIGRFTCGGGLSINEPIQLVYINTGGAWCGATLPGLTDTELQSIIGSSTVASFGKGSETVTDKSYRDAYALTPDKFITSFQLSATSILADIQRILAPGVANVHAELYKLNIYTSPTGCFKSHVDTPRAGTMFGSLVVCLPCSFKGGALVTRHHDQQIVYDWSLTPSSGPSVQWAAFYSDVEHEILQVTEGYRVTLTYNLYHDDMVEKRAIDETTSRFYNNLKAALSMPHFLREGGVLGFACQHDYPFEKGKVTSTDESKRISMLKGADYTVLLAAKSLGLEVVVRPVANIAELYDSVHHDPEHYFLNDKFGHDHHGFHFLDVEENFIYKDCQYEEYWKTYLQNETDFDISDADHITWCQKFKHIQPAYTGSLPMGNDPYTADVCYQAVAILVTVPSWGERKEQMKLVRQEKH